VIKPCELTPLTTLTLARLASEAGLPDGVFNVVTGLGADAGTALAGHRDVDVVTFTGSTPVGRKVMAAAAVHGHRTQLELGGKAPFVVFDDADLDAAIQGAVAGSLINTGQDCTAATRAIVARPLYDDFVAGVGELMSKVVVGDPEDDDTDLGPLISMAHRAKVAGMVERAPDQATRPSRTTSSMLRSCSSSAGASSPAAAHRICRDRSTVRRSLPMSARTLKSTATRSSVRC
jgi:betaine-aldehyde dehydrogenase